MAAFSWSFEMWQKSMCETSIKFVTRRVLIERPECGAGHACEWRQAVVGTMHGRQMSFKFVPLNLAHMLASDWQAGISSNDDSINPKQSTCPLLKGGHNECSAALAQRNPTSAFLVRWLFQQRRNAQCIDYRSLSSLTRSQPSRLA